MVRASDVTVHTAVTAFGRPSIDNGRHKTRNTFLEFSIALNGLPAKVRRLAWRSLLKTLSTTRVPDNGAFARRFVLGRTAAAHSFVSLVLRPRRYLPCTRVCRYCIPIITVMIMLVVFQKFFVGCRRVTVFCTTARISLDCHL